MTFKSWQPLVRMIPKGAVGWDPKPAPISSVVQRWSNFPFTSSYLLDCSAETNSFWGITTHCSSLQVHHSSAVGCSSPETCHCFLGIINEHGSVSSAPPGQVLAGHGQQAASFGGLGGSGCRVGHCWGELAGVCWVHVCSGVGQKSHCAPFVHRFSLPSSEGWPQCHPKQTHSLAHVSIPGAVSCVYKFLKHKQWVSTIYSRHFTEKRQRIDYVK